MTALTEADVESAAFGWLAVLGRQTAHGPDLALNTSGAERDDYVKVNT